ncbi:MAG: hypothetical protein IT371_20390 [Deltaproteobacteria bacterium]|nr:hypothetical protein [Deltaproteobacteria bacterium]
MRSYLLALWSVVSLAAGAANAAEPKARPPLQTEREVQKAVQNRGLPHGHPMRQALYRLNRLWGDANIMDGRVKAFSGRIAAPRGGASPAELQTWAKQVLTTALIVDEEPAAQRSKVFLRTKGAILDTAKRVARDGFCYAPENEADLLDLKKAIGRNVKRLGAEDRVQRVLTVGQVNVGTADEPEFRRATVSLFLGPDSGTFVGFYTREGSY